MRRTNPGNLLSIILFAKRVLPNSMDKFRAVLMFTIEVTNHHRKRSRKPRVISENRDNSRRREDDKPGERNG
ncbi:hypothetical protein TNCV_3834591 [Trichonephila clavipes]|nr:hypothetical protein TNCV_3834591 [Trichonephila clavipes]